MFDVLPPSPRRSASGGGQLPRRRPNRRARPRVPQVASHQPAASPPPGPRVVKLEWRLPARLRRPVQETLAQERRKQARRRAIVQFERRPIYSDLPSAYPNHRGSKAAAQPAGSEQHTGDVYMHSRPEVQLPVPPYAGSFARLPADRQGPRSVRQVRSPRRTATAPPPSHVPRRSIRPSPPAPRRPVAASSPWLEQDMRDVPYQWGQAATDTPRAASSLPATIALPGSDEEVLAVKQPRRRFALPLHFSFLPLNLWPKKKDGVTQPLPEGLGKKKLSKRTVSNLVFLLLGCAAATGSVWLLQQANQGYLALGTISQRAETALGHVLAAQSALAETDFEASEQEFAQAEQLLREARSELTTALAASQAVLAVIDVSGTVRSGTELLAAGEELTRAGQSVSRGIKPLLDAQVIADETAAVGGGSTMVDALGVTVAEFAQAREALGSAQASLDQVESPLLPPEVAAQVETLQVAVPKVHRALSSFLDQSTVIMSMLGADRTRQYLILFENNHEMRPTGGFIGSLGLVNVDRGVVEDIDVQTVYDPDGQLKEFIAPPGPLTTITDRWYLRDANWFVDFSVSAQKAADFFEKEGGPTVDGVLAMTPEVIKGLLTITGPIAVPGYDVTVDHTNFVALTQDQVTYSYDRAENRPKQFLADLTPLLLNRLFAAKAESSLKVLGVLGQMIQEKHFLIYFRDEQVQQLIREAGWDGSLPPEQQGFLSVNNANIGGHKSDQFMEQEIDYRTEIKESGEADVMVTIRRTHRGPEERLDYPYPPGDDPADKQNIVYQRVLVPLNAQLLEAGGFTREQAVPRLITANFDLPVEPDAEVAEWQRQQTIHPGGTVIGGEAGYTYFANWLVTKPGETSVAWYHYRVPEAARLPGVINTAQRYQQYVFKQPGDTRTQLRAELKLPPNHKIVHTVPQDGITHTPEQTVVYRGALRHDVLTGVVFERQP